MICKRCLAEPAYSYIDALGRNYTKKFCKRCRIILDNERKTANRKSPEGIEYNRNYKLKSKFGITSEQYDKMFDKQNGLCYVCQTPSKVTLHVDHCHKTNKVRKLLCVNCNTALGHLREDEAIILNLLKYLRKHNATF